MLWRAGAANKLIPTLTASRLEGISVMFIYSATVTAVATELHRRDISIKFW
jgi:hypothetical protein